jgi:hypothetical protein
MPRSINRWPVLGERSSDLAIGTVPGTTIRLRMRADVLPLFLALAAEYHRTVAPLRKGECGAYSHREARAAAAWSDHASGTAMDLNWRHEGAQGPRGGMATMSKAQIKACAALKKRFKVVIWGGDKARGGDYSQPRYWDPMHYALKPGTSVAEVRAVIKALRIRPDGTIAPPPKPTRGRAKVTDPDGAWSRREPAGRKVRLRKRGETVTYVGVRRVDDVDWLHLVSGNWLRSSLTSRGA